jgi:hypothetical protein
MKTTGLGDVNMYSPQMGQSQSVDRSIHLCELSIDVGIQALQICVLLAVTSRHICYETHFAVEEVLAQAHPTSTYATVGTMIDGLVLSILPELADVAVILRRDLSAVDAQFGGTLRCGT